MTTTDANQQEPSDQARRIKSFVIRSGRMTASQKLAYNAHMAKWSLAVENGPINFTNTFDNNNPVVLEIGFGMGDSLIQMACHSPQQNFIGVEVHRPGVGRLLHLAEERKLDNIRIYCADAIDVLEQCIPEDSLERVNIFFPDPWHKKKHQKRRLINSNFLTLVHSRMQTDGLLHIATDWQNYAEQIILEIEKNSLFNNISRKNQHVDAADFNRPETKFERRGIKSGHQVWDMAFRAKQSIFADEK